MIDVLLRSGEFFEGPQIAVEAGFYEGIRFLKPDPKAQSLAVPLVSPDLSGELDRLTLPRKVHAKSNKVFGFDIGQSHPICAFYHFEGAPCDAYVR